MKIKNIPTRLVPPRSRNRVARIGFTKKGKRLADLEGGRISDTTTRPTLKVYYDASCPVCRRERARYERLTRQDSSVEWWDATDHARYLEARGISLQQALLSLHVETAVGQIEDGMPAYRLLLARIPGMSPLGWLITRPLIQPLLTRYYDAWVRRRLCNDGRLERDERS
ncbi:thiol-disulfide oxidoreductase DCC family protein [Cobetia crustatorum]|uniref:thiol-disulfide oxidoreductase DCC family protein n=2 Tax=Halomonadaceae TaxID=28256 RepID=UPI001FE5878D|nr:MULTISPECIES: DCC1-like thiol-disulfide oxidoreductase family protein [Cobetia]